MLETKPQPIGRAARATTPRPWASPAYTGRAATARAVPERDVRVAERAARQATSGRSREQRLARSETRLLTWTVAAAVLVCGLLVVYLAAYARVTTLGIAQSHMRAALRADWQENQLLRAQEAALKNPYRVAAQAERLGLTRKSKPPVYIPPSAAVPDAPAPIMLGAAPQADAFSDSDSMTTTDSDPTATRGGGEAGPQRTDSGPTKNDNSTAFHH